MSFPKLYCDLLYAKQTSNTVCYIIEHYKTDSLNLSISYMQWHHRPVEGSEYKDDIHSRSINVNYKDISPPSSDEKTALSSMDANMGTIYTHELGMTHF